MAIQAPHADDVEGVRRKVAVLDPACSQVESISLSAELDHLRIQIDADHLKSSVGGDSREETGGTGEIQQTSGLRHVRSAELEAQNAVLDAYRLARQIIPICGAPIFRRGVYAVHFLRQQPGIHECEPAAATLIPPQHIAVLK